MIVAPIFSAPGFNLRARVLLSVLIAALVAPSMSIPSSFDLLSAVGLLMSLQEIAVGLMIGFILQLAFGAIVFGAQAMSMTMGLGFAMAVDPQNGVQVPVVAQLYVILGTLLFLSVDGHLALIDAVVQSYNLCPHRLAQHFFFILDRVSVVRIDSLCWWHFVSATCHDSFASY